MYLAEYIDIQIYPSTLLVHCGPVSLYFSVDISLWDVTLSRVWFVDKSVWYKNSLDELEKAMKKPNTNKAKNLVLAIGDGMGVTTTTGTMFTSAIL